MKPGDDSCYLVSACLIGINCRFDAKNSRSDRVMSFLKGKDFVPVCPEQLGGLPTPRPPCRFYGGDGSNILKGNARLIDTKGEDKTEIFIRGAREALKIARISGVTHAVLNDRSPSCGIKEVYVGKEKVTGMGVTSALLESEGIIIISDEEI